jgi:arabinose-5-phosphate isomerase
VLLLDEAGRLAGMFTDSDLARLLERRRDDAFDGPISAVMNSAPLTVHPESQFVDIVELLADRKISELPVIDNDGRPVGLIDITDVIGWLPQNGE